MKKIKLKRNFNGLDSETNEQWKKTIEAHVIACIVNHRERFIGDYIKQNFSKLMAEDHLLTSEDVMKKLKISRQTLGRRIKAGILKPVNPEAKRNYRFQKSDIKNYIEGKEKHYD